MRSSPRPHDHLNLIPMNNNPADVAPELPALGAPRLGDRSLFPHLEPRVYLNHSAISPASLPVVAALAAIGDDYARHGVAAFPRWNAQRARLRARLARLINVAPDDLAFVQSTTRGLCDIALCFPYSAGDRIIVFEGEFPSNVSPWQRAAALFGLEIVFLPLTDYERPGGPDLSRLEAELKRGARLVAASVVQFQTGLRMPIERMTSLCHAHGAQICVDAIQALGAVPFDAKAAGVDYLACGSHKWLMGLEGAGFVYICPDRVAELRPAIAGWLSHEDGLGFLFEGGGRLRYDRPIRKRADFLEAGNLNAAGLAALEASVSLIEAIGVPAIYEHANRYIDALERGLVDRGFASLRSPDPARRSAILGVRPPPSANVIELQRALLARGVACSTPDGVLRFAPQWPNNQAEIPYALEAVDGALAS